MESSSSTNDIKIDNVSAESEDDLDVNAEDEEDFLDVGVADDIDLDTSEIEQMSINV